MGWCAELQFNSIPALWCAPAGPVLLEDYHLLEKLAQFDRERIPERVVHARGFSAKGFFEVTHDVSHLTCADFLRSPGVQTPLIVRFSTVIHERGSPETLRDPRGFAVKFYTREGNFDMVGNNIPVFFIRDGMQVFRFSFRSLARTEHMPMDTTIGLQLFFFLKSQDSAARAVRCSYM